MDNPCPTPDKIGYATKSDAIDAWRRVRRGDQQRRGRHKPRRGKDVTPYRCDPAWGCGSWHLGRRKRRMRDK